MKTDLLRDLLYEKMFRMRAVQPWKTLAMDQIFALKIAGNTYYLQIAEHDTDRILRIHQDANDLKSCLMMQEYHPASDSRLEMFAQALSQSTLICALTVQEALDGEEMKAVRTYAREHGISLRGRFAWPQFVRLVSFQPGREPEPDEEHAMLECLDAVNWLAEHMEEKGLKIRSITSHSQLMTLVRKEADGYTAEDMAMPKLPEAEMPEGESHNDIYKMKTKKLVKWGTWYCALDIQSEPELADDAEGDSFAWELYTFDLDVGLPVPVQAVRDYVHHTDVMLDRLMEAIFREEHRPDTIRVSDQRTEKLLRGWCSAVGIRLSRGEVPVEVQAFEEDEPEDEDPEETISELHEMLDLLLIMPDEMLLHDPEELAEEKKYLQRMVLFPDTPEELREKIRKVLRKLDDLLNQKPGKMKKLPGKKTKGPEKAR